jgi:hypothetical protein
LSWRLFDRKIDNGGNFQLVQAADIAGIDCVAKPQPLGDHFAHDNVKSGIGRRDAYSTFLYAF